MIGRDAWRKIAVNAQSVSANQRQINPARPQLVITFKLVNHLLFGILDFGFWDLGFLTFDIFDIFYI